jgi:D-arabinose 1-dehydrogenase-like Zn-dependent alcohol dehydrogenase
MGSKADLQATTDFIAQHWITPVVSRVLDGLENAEEGFELLARGEHFGKIFIRMDGSSTSAKR